MITQVTFTGIDNRTNIERLVAIQERYPFVEFGLLVARSRQGKENRYPDLDADNFLGRLRGRGLNLSCHVCGGLARNAVTACKDDESREFSLQELDDYLGLRLSLFKRVQLNVAGATCLPETVYFYIPGSIQELIIQTNPVKGNFKRVVTIGDVETAYLADASGGRGIETDFIPLLWSVRTGYAGGLRPDNVLEKIQPLLSVRESVDYRNDFWIDMESGVRTDDWFDLDKVEAVLERLTSDNNINYQLGTLERKRLIEEENRQRESFIRAMGDSMLKDEEFSSLPMELYRSYIEDAIWRWKTRIGCKRMLRAGDEKAWSWIRENIVQNVKKDFNR